MSCLFVICLGLLVLSEGDSVHMCSIWDSVCKVVLLCLIVTCLILCVQLLAMMWLVDICVSLLAFNITERLLIHHVLGIVCALGLSVVLICSLCGSAICKFAKHTLGMLSGHLCLFCAQWIHVQCFMNHLCDSVSLQSHRWIAVGSCVFGLACLQVIAVTCNTVIVLACMCAAPQVE